MSVPSQVLREYLVSLGFKVDVAGERRFDGALFGMNKTALGLGAALASAQAATVALVQTFASSMERLGYSAKLADSSAKSLKALEFAGEKVGVGADTMRAAIIGIARELRMNPGLTGLLEGFGIQVRGRDVGKVALDMLSVFKQMPFAIGARYMREFFGMDPDTYKLLTDGLDALKASVAEQEALAKAAGVDADEAARAAKEYENMYRTLSQKIDLLGKSLAMALLPTAREFLKYMDEGVDYLTKKVMQAKKFWSGTGFLDGNKTSDDVNAAIKKASPSGTPYGAYSEFASKARGALWDWWMGSGTRKESAPNAAARDKGAAQSSIRAATEGDPQAYLSALETYHGLPAGTLDRTWSAESSRGRNMLSPKGAMGHFGFMSGTAKDVGVKDPNDFYDSGAGAARYIRQLLDKYGDIRLAMAAYNWGMGNLDKLGVEKAPDETRKYVQKTTGQPLIVNQTTTINVTAPDAHAAAREVARAQQGVGADVARNLSTAVQ